MDNVDDHVESVNITFVFTAWSTYGLKHVQVHSLLCMHAVRCWCHAFTNLCISSMFSCNLQVVGTRFSDWLAPLQLLLIAYSMILVQAHKL